MGRMEQTVSVYVCVINECRKWCSAYFTTEKNTSGLFLVVSLNSIWPTTHT